MSLNSLAGDLVLWTTPERFYVSCEDLPAKILIIDRITNQISVEPYRHQIPAIVGRRAIIGILGLINLVSGPHLVVGLNKRRVGHLTSDNHIVWKLDGVEAIPFLRSDLHLTEPQREAGMEQKRMVEDMLNTPSMYFSLTLDITNCQQKLDGLMENDAVAKYKILSTASPTFTWNYSLLQNGGFVQNREFHPWCLALVHGAVLIHECSLDGKLFRWTIISRRSNKRAGTRFFRRGCDRKGYVANFVETEQILEHKETLTSFVQIRGSMPFFWSQIPTLRYMPKPVIEDHGDHAQAVNLHMENLVHNYGPMVVVNLINHVKAEGVLESHFRSLVKGCAYANHVDYEPFDFHAECPRLKWDRLNFLLGRLGDRLKNFGCFVRSRGSVSRLQTGVIRTNCMDCLDRTNVVQSMIASENLSLVLKMIGIMPEGDAINGHTDFYNLFRNVWAEHANMIAIQYGGSGALKTDFTRTGQRTLTGVLRDGKIAILRYIMNNFGDGYRQDATDLVLGHVGQEVLSEGPREPMGKNRKWTFYLPLALLMLLSMLRLTTLLFSESGTDLILFLIFVASSVSFILLMISRHSQTYIDLPKYCPIVDQSK